MPEQPKQNGQHHGNSESPNGKPNDSQANGGAQMVGAGQLAKYEILKRIGSGKFSVVYKARRQGGGGTAGSAAAPQAMQR